MPSLRRLTPAQLTGLSILAVMVFLALLGLLAPPCLSSLSPASINVPPFQNPQHLFGTDGLGRDLLTMILKGAAGTLFVGLAAALSASIFGYCLGAFSALCGGLVDSLLMRLVDALLSVPAIVLLLTISSLISSPEFTRTMLSVDGLKQLAQALSLTDHSLGYLPILSVVAAIAATNWLESARVARAITQKLMTEEYMTAARSLGAGSLHLLRFHLGPALKAVAALETTLLTADAIIMESGLTYLGLGLGPATPSWGGMLKDAQSGLLCGNLHGAVLPGLFLALTVMGINLLATGGSRQPQRARSKEQD